MEDRPHKAHRAAQSGNKAEKKKGGKERHEKGFNPKAFAPKSGIRADRQGRRTAELSQQRLHVPLVDRTPTASAAPPIIVAIAGPPGVGKSTLLRSLVRRYTKQTGDLKGPVTVVAGKRRRITFVEVNNDLNAMLDVGKVADLVLLMIDGSFGFEMETFELLTILQSHGFPKILGILTHLDLIRSSATLTATKKMLKKRFWTEIHAGAKLFYLSGVLNGRYPDREILNLSRFLGVMKFRPLVWRNAHPYLLADRLEDLTPRALLHASPNVDRTITLYGYLHGAPLRASQTVHVPGAGDFQLKSVKALGDPCPIPGEGEEKRRRMSEKRKLVVHAPMSDLGGVAYDADAVYINVPGSFTRGEDGPRGEGERMVMDLQDVKGTLDEKVKSSEIRLFGSSRAALASSSAVTLDDLDEDDDDEGELEEDEDGSEDEEGLDDLEDGEGEDFDQEDVDDEAMDPQADQGRTSRRQGRAYISQSSRNDNSDVAFADSDDDLGNEDTGHVQTEMGNVDIPSDEEDEDEEVPRWKRNLSANAASLASGSKKRAKDWTKLIYESILSAEAVVSSDPAAQSSPANEEDEDDDEEFFKLKDDEGQGEEEGEGTKIRHDQADLARWEEEELLDSIRGLFITGPREDAPADEADEFEDVEGQDDEFEGADAPPPDQSSKDTRASLATRKAELKRKFDEQYDDPSAPKQDFYEEAKDALSKQAELNDAELAGADSSIAGFRAGIYVRIELHGVPAELVTNFDPSYPLLVGGLSAAEERTGYLNVRIKRHRWHNKTLKSHDPLIFSLGWRRFQSAPVYALDDHSIRLRLLKYTPEHMHCYASFFGPAAAPNTGLCAFNTLSGAAPGFRVAATGVVLDIDRSTQIVKKLKLTGVPYKIFKNTAFIKDMFTSSLEVAKFEGAHIKTVSGIRGQIKKALPKPDGALRATFEDKVLMSDLIFLRAWVSVQPRKYYNPVTSLLLRDKTTWAGARLTGQVRAAQGIAAPLRADSTYKRVERAPRRFNALRVPKGLQAALPYASKPKIMKAQHKSTYLQKRAVVREPEERRAVALMQQIRALRKDQVQRRREKQGERKAKHREAVEKDEKRKEEKRKGERKEYMRVAGVKSKRAADEEAGNVRKKGRRA